jgi:hypothetical protein
MQTMKLTRIGIIIAILSLHSEGFAQSADLSLPSPLSISQVAELVASDGQPFDSLGIAVAISGKTVVAGAVNHNQTQGAAYVFTGEGQVAELTASDGMMYDYFGSAVAISGDTIVVGSPLGDNEEEPGSVYVYVKPSTGWTNMTETAKLTVSDAMNGDLFGTSVAITGNTIVVGARHPNGPTLGEAYVFVEPPSGWMDMTETAILTASDGEPQDQFGNSVAISGNTVVVGAPVATIQQGGQGVGYVFVEPQTGWVDMTQTGKLVASDPQSGAQLGYSASIDGDTIVLGAPRYSTQFYSTQGASYIFKEPKNGWKNVASTALLTASDGNAFNFFGSSVAINGNNVVVGSPADTVNGNFQEGAAYIFVRPRHGWQSTSHFEFKLVASDGEANDGFGDCVAIERNLGVAGSPGHPVGSNQEQGAAYFFMER